MSQSQLSEDQTAAFLWDAAEAPPPELLRLQRESEVFFGFVFFYFTLDAFSAIFHQTGGFSRLTAALTKASSLSCHVLRSWTIKTIVISRVGTQTKAF